MPNRNVRKLVFRPPLPRREIVWFPKFDSEEYAARFQRFRLQHDTRAAKTPTYLALVFPFHANLTVMQLVSHIKRVTVAWPVLPLTLRGIDSVTSANGLFTILRCDLRHEAVSALHDRLYSGVLAGFLRDDIAYQPHITLAQSHTNHAFEASIADAELRFRETYHATLRELTIITHAADGTITIDESVSLSRE